MNHSDDSEEHNQQRGEGQGLLKRMPDFMLVGDAIEGRQQNNHQQANQAHRSEVKCQGKYQNHRDKRLYLEFCLGSGGGAGLLVLVETGQDLAHVFRHQRAVAKPARYLEQDTGNESTDQDRHCDGRHVEEEGLEVPASYRCNQ